MPRDELECDLTLTGFLIMENRLKPKTTQIIEELKRANIRPVMVTGDNVLTALSVARECHMIDHGQDVIILQATVTNDETDAILSWYYADIPQSIEPITVVSAAQKVLLSQKVFHLEA